MATTAWRCGRHTWKNNRKLYINDTTRFFNRSGVVAHVLTDVQDIGGSKSTVRRENGG